MESINLGVFAMVVLVALQVHSVWTTNYIVNLRSGKGLALNAQSHPLDLVECGDIDCVFRCNRNESCTATQYDIANMLCTMISCNEIELTNKSGSQVTIKSTNSLYLFT